MEPITERTERAGIPETGDTGGTSERSRALAVDPPEARPGVPMEAEPEAMGAGGGSQPTPQPGAARHLRRAALDAPTPVVGTAQPPRGLSGLLRRRAYDVPERRARHWMLLLLADRVDVLEDRIGSALAEPLETLGWTRGSAWVRKDPLRALGTLVGTVWVARRALGRGRRRG